MKRAPWWHLLGEPERYGGKGGDGRVRHVTVKDAWQWVRREYGGMMDEYVTMAGFWIFSTVVVVVAAGLIWGALAGDLKAMVSDLTHLF